MPNIGGFELMLIAVIVLLLFGAKRLPEVGASIGKGIREFKRSIADTQDQINAPAQSQGLPGRQFDADMPAAAPPSGEPKRLSQ